MLTLDLLRFRIAGNTVRPVYLTLTGGRKYRDIAEHLLALYKASIGHTVGELDDAVEEYLGIAPDYKVYRGLVKILSGYATIGPTSDMDAEELRKTVFTAAAKLGPPVRKSDLLFHQTASDKLVQIAGETGISVESLASSLYCDLKENQVISSFDSSVTGEDIIERYNTALAQAMLFRATRMVVDVFDSYRTVFTHIKLARLMHSIKPRDGGYRISIDGPASLFSNVERYGIAMANVLPAILKCEKWQLWAKVNIGADDEKLFTLDPKVGLKSHYRDQPMFDSSPEEAFYEKFSRNKKSKWKIEREGSVLDLKDAVLIPDFKFSHKDGRVAHLEIVGFWTPEYLQRKLDKLSKVEESNVVLAVAESLNCSRSDYQGTVIRYKQRLLLKDVLPALEYATFPTNRASVEEAPGKQAGLKPNP